MLHPIHAPLAQPDPALPPVELRVDRQKLAKRLWRAAAADGTEFGFELEKPLQPGDTFFQSEHVRYVIVQEPESLLEIALDLPASAAAGVGWAIGNLHLELMSEPSRLLTPNEKAVRQLLDRIGIPYRPVSAVFRPGRFARGEKVAQTHELGSSHRH